ncbi:hypothetical protein BH11ARM1_BH11ARM1_10760 [soil metagenome]
MDLMDKTSVHLTQCNWNTWNLHDGSRDYELHAHRMVLLVSALEVKSSDFNFTLYRELPYSFAGKTESGSTIAYRTKSDPIDFDFNTLTFIQPGILWINHEQFLLQSVNGRATVEVRNHEEKAVLTATRPWKDAEAHVMWRYECTVHEDEFTRLALLLAPWIASFVVPPERGTLQSVKP